jgi:hypothetical protein
LITRSSLQRLIIGYSSMLILMVAVSGYSIIQLGKLSNAANIALKVDQRMIDYSEQLADAFLSEVRYAGQFNVTHATQHHEQYLQFRSDFDRYTALLKPLARSSGAVQRLARAEEYHAQYRQLFEKEVVYIKTKQPYAETRFREEKERLVDYLLRESEAFKSDVQKGLQERIEHIEHAAMKSQKITLAATLLLVIVGIFFACYLGAKIPQEGERARGVDQTAIRRFLCFQYWRKGHGATK